MAVAGDLRRLHVVEGAPSRRREGGQVQSRETRDRSRVLWHAERLARPSTRALRDPEDGGGRTGRRAKSGEGVTAPLARGIHPWLAALPDARYVGATITTDEART